LISASSFSVRVSGIARAERGHLYWGAVARAVGGEQQQRAEILRAKDRSLTIDEQNVATAAKTASRLAWAQCW